jgi:hypothetical protein
MAETWYDNLTVAGNTSLNPFFYGTYLGETKPNEPVTRNKRQAFQADAVGAMKQLVPEHFKTPHTFRVEWQPGRGGRLDWFTKSYKKVDENGTTIHVEGDGKGQDWEHSLSIPDFALDAVMGSKIPEEPSYIIFNTAISSTWAFPYSLPDWCPKCYDCNNPKCTCSFNPGFCNMMKTGKVALKIDSVRVYQSRDDDAHSGNPHTVGCDPEEFPTREYIKGYEYRYMRNPPFVYEDKHPLRRQQNGGGECVVDEDCGGGGIETEDVDEDWKQPESQPKAEDDVLDLDNDSSGGSDSSIKENESPQAHGKKDSGKTKPKVRRQLEVDNNIMTAEDKDDADADDDASDGLDKPPIASESIEETAGDTKVYSNPDRQPKGSCVSAIPGLFGLQTNGKKQCKCNQGYTGPHCLSVDKFDDAPGAYDVKKMKTLFEDRPNPYLTSGHLFIGGLLIGAFLVFGVVEGTRKNRRIRTSGSEMAPLVRQ